MLKRFLVGFLAMTFALSVVVALPGQNVQAVGITYYVSYSSGNDSNNGTSSSTPWKNLGKVSGITFNAGDSILLKCGDTWTGETLTLQGDGSSTSPVTLSSYGTGAKPVISPQITDSACVKIHNYDGWKIMNLELKNAMYGVYLEYEDVYNKDYIYIDNLNIHDIDDTYNSLPNKYNHISSGISVQSYKTGIHTEHHLDNLTAKNITMNNVNCGWWVGTMYSHTDANGFGPRSRIGNVTIENLMATDCKQWGYSLHSMETATITNVDCTNTGFGTNPYGSCGILAAYSNYITLDGCDSRFSHRGPQAYDGVGFDFEGGSNTHDITYKNSIVEYSDGAGIFVFNNGGTGGTANAIMDTLTISYFGQNPGNSSQGIYFYGGPSQTHSTGQVKYCTFNRDNTAREFYNGYPGAVNGFTFTSNTYNTIVAGTPTPTPTPMPTPVGTNIAPSATLSVDSTNSSYTKDKAVDGNKTDPLSRWISANTAEPHWFQMDWASNKQINQVKVWSGHPSSGATGWQIDDYDIQYWNGSTWQTVASVTNNTADGSLGQYNNLSFTAITTNKLRMYITDGTVNVSTDCRLIEIEVYEQDTVGATPTPTPTPTTTPTPADTNIAPTATLTVDSTNTTYTADKAVDGIKNDSASRWISDSTAEPHWFQLDWASDKVINIVKVWSGSMAGVGWQIDDYEIQYWNGSVWQTAVSVVSNTQDGYYGQYNNLTFTDITTNKLRMYITDGTTQAGYTNARLLEIEVWGH